MDHILVVVFNELSKALEGREALKSLDRDDSITAYAYAVITKKADGTSVVNKLKCPVFVASEMSGFVNLP
ncbi:MAG: hypothetical protein ABSD89_15380 [Halobacteriota archaeon]